MQEANWTGLSDEEIAAGLERQEAAMQQAKGTAERVAWYATFVCAMTGVGVVALAWINRNSPATWWMSVTLAPLISGLPVVFFRIAREQRQMENQIRELRDRVEVLERLTTDHRSA